MVTMRAATVSILFSIVLFFSPGQLSADLIASAHWSGIPIEGEDPGFLPSGWAFFDVTGSQLTITLTNSTQQTINAPGQLLTGLAFSSDSGATLTAVSAIIAPGSRLVNPDTPGVTDLSGEWAYRDDLAMNEFGTQTLGDQFFGISASGAEDIFGGDHRFNTDPSLNLFPPANGSPNGLEAGILGPNADYTNGGFNAHGPYVQGWDGNSTGPGTMVFSFVISGIADPSSLAIYDIDPIFGTDGAPLVVPEPSTILLFGIGALAVGMSLIRRNRTKHLARGESS